MVKIKEIMKKHVITVDPKINISDVSKIMTNNRIGSVVVMEGDKPMGIVTDDDIVGVIARGLNPKKVKIKDLKTKKRFITASPEDDILKTTKKMIKSGVKRIPVIKDGKLQGIISDKEILMVSPEMINILSERLKARVALVAHPDKEISGICERCESYSDELQTRAGRWLCIDCRE